MDVCSIVLADDHVMFRQGVKRIIEDTPGLEVVGEANDGLELLNLLKAQEPALVLLDISMPHLRGLEATREIKKLYPRVKVIFLTMHRTREFLQQALEAGADGFLLKEDTDVELLRAIQTVRGGESSSQPSCPARWRIWPCGTIRPTPIPCPPGKRPSLSSWWKARLQKKSPTCSISASSRCAGTGKTSCGNST
jgi:CheY-like chemotaxis protein